MLRGEARSVEVVTRADVGRRGVAAAQRFMRAVLESVGRGLERRRWMALGLLLALYVPVVVVEAHAHPLSNDEIYTVHIAQAPTMRAMWAMEREIDLHPPVHYLLVREALRLPGPRWLTARLPSMLAGAAATALLFLLTAARLGNVLGVVSAAVLWTGPLEDFFWSDRPYMIGTALLLLLVCAYLRVCRASGGRRLWGLGLVCGLSGLMIADQLIGIAWLGAFAGAEAVRTWRRRRVDGAMLLALFAPSGLAAGFVYQMRHLVANAFPASQIPSFGWATSMFNAQVTQMFFLVSVAAVAGAFLWPGLDGDSGREERPVRMDEQARAVFIGLVLVPVVLMVVSVALRLQYWERYSACSVIGFAGLIPWMLYRRMPRLEVRGPLLLLVFAGTTLAQVAGDAGRGGRVPGRVGLSALGGLPIVAANPMTFTEMSDREPRAVAERVFYLTDRAEAERVAGYTLFENEEKIVRILGLASHAEAAAAFYAEHPRFWLIADPRNRTEWLLHSLVEHGATVAWKGKIQPGYDDEDLYLVTVPGD